MEASAIVHIMIVDLAVADVLLLALGTGIQDMAEHILTLWADQIRTKVILVEAEWYRSHGAKYK
jgi:hypothetical protein